MIRNGGFLDDNVRYAKNMMDLEQYQQQINELQQELQRKDNIINELKEYLDSRSEFTNFGAVLNKIKELENDN